VIGPFVFLTLRSFKNRLLNRLRRLKEVRYLLGAVIGGGYFFFLFTRGHPGGRAYQRMTTLDMGALLALALLLLAWILPNLSSLAFSEAELHFVIGGPVSRRRVLLYKLVNSQVQILIGILVTTFLGIPNGLFIGLWVAYTTFALYNTFVAIARHRLLELGVRGWWISTAAFAAMIGTAWTVIHFAHRPRPGGGSPFDDPMLTPLLFVPRVLARPLFAKTLIDVATSSAVVAAIGVAFFFASSSLRVQFDELVQTASERVTRFRARMQGQPDNQVSFRRLRAPFRLAEGSSPEMAIVWKNFTAIMRMAFSGVITILAFEALFLAGTILWKDPGLKAMCAGFTLATACIFPILGSIMFKQDYRLDVTRADVLKTWPIEGERLIAAEIAAPLVTMSVIELLLIIAAAVATGIAAGSMTKFATPQIIVIALLFATPLCAIQLLLRNAVAVVFPGWGFRSREEQRGFVAMGQRILSAIINLVVLSLFLAPAAAVSAIGLWLAAHFAGDNAAILAGATMPAVFLLAAECWLFVKILGAQYDKLDVGRDLEPMAM
jgi:hypothetical protein